MALRKTIWGAKWSSLFFFIAAEGTPIYLHMLLSRNAAEAGAPPENEGNIAECGCLVSRSYMCSLKLLLMFG